MEQWPSAYGRVEQKKKGMYSSLRKAGLCFSHLTERSAVSLKSSLETIVRTGAGLVSVSSTDAF